MEKKLMLSLVLYSLVFCLNAADQYFYDAQGRSNGYSSLNGKTTIYCNAQGAHRITATTSQNGKKVTYRDAQGIIAGTATKNGNTVTYRDAQGRIHSRATISDKKITYRDAQGRNIGNAAINHGSVTYRDSQGRITGISKGKSHAGADGFILFHKSSAIKGHSGKL